MNLRAQQINLIPLLCKHSKLVPTYLYTTNISTIRLMYLWFNNLSIGTFPSTVTNAKQWAKLKVSTRSSVLKAKIFSPKTFSLRTLIPTYPGILKKSKRQKYPKVVSSRLNTAKLNSVVWSETYLANLSFYQLIGFRAHSNNKRRMTPLTVNLNPFKNLQTSQKTSAPQNLFSTNHLLSPRAQKLIRYLNLRGAKLVSLQSDLSHTPKRFLRKVFSPRRGPFKRNILPNPYLFLGLKNSFKPSNLSPSELFQASLLSYAHKLKINNRKALSKKSTRSHNLLKYAIKRSSFIKKRNLWFLKKHSSDKSFQSRSSMNKLNKKNKALRATTLWLRSLNPNHVNPELKNPKTLETHQITRTQSVSASTLKLLNLYSYRNRTKATCLNNLNPLPLFLKNKLTTSFSLSHPKTKVLKLLTLRRERSKRFNWSIQKLNFYVRRKVIIKAPYAYQPLKRSSNVLTPTVSLLKRTFLSFNHSTFKKEPLKKLILQQLLNLPSWPISYSTATLINRDYIKPTSSYGFVRSPFFFTHFWLPNRTTSYDIVGSRYLLKPRHSYVLFPEANSIKTNVFRHLTNQRLLAQTRLLKFNTIANKSSFLKNANFVDYSNINPKATYSPQLSTLPSSTSLWSLGRTLDSIKSSNYKLFRPKRIRFKPGYSRMWRIARTSIKEILDIKARYQYRLNPKLHQYYFQSRNSNKLKQSLTIEFALMGAHFAPDRDAVYSLLSSNNVFLNGSAVSNNHLRLFTNDFIQLIIHLKFYIALRWLKSWSIIRKNRTSKIFYRKYRPSTFNKNIRIVRRLPRWFFDIETTYGNIPRCFEVDYFTLSIFVLPYPIISEKLLPSRAYMFDPTILNMYNWKYIT